MSHGAVPSHSISYRMCWQANRQSCKRQERKNGNVENNFCVSLPERCSILSWQHTEWKGQENNVELLKVKKKITQRSNLVQAPLSAWNVSLLSFYPEHYNLFTYILTEKEKPKLTKIIALVPWNLHFVVHYNYCNCILKEARTGLGVAQHSTIEFSIVPYTN